MTTRVKETERKYEPAEAGRLAGVPGLGGGEEILLDAVYHDTADLRLAREGVTLRRRTGGADEGWHLKLPMGGDTREEVRAKDPKALADLVQGLARGEALAPIAHIRTKRRRWELRDDDGRVAAEVVEDDVVGQTLGHAEEIKAWREVEVELVEGGDEVFDTMERRLGRPSDAPPKLVRLLGDRLPKQRKPSNEYLERQVKEIERQDIRIRQDGDDAVHQMRVASRRIRSVLQAYKGSRYLIRELRWLGGVLAPARDLEVLREHLQADINKLPSELVLGNVRQRLTETFAPREQRARDEVLRTLNSERYFALLNRLDALRLPLKHTKQRLRKTKRRVNRAWVNGTLHDVRKAAKRVRYTAEAADKPKLAHRMKKLQKRLGVHQDSVVAREELRTMGIQSHLDGDNAFTYGLLYGCELRRAERVEESLPRKRKV